MRAVIIVPNSEAAAQNHSESPAIPQEASRPENMKTETVIYGAPWAQRRPVSARPRPTNPWLGL